MKNEIEQMGHAFDMFCLSPRCNEGETLPSRLVVRSYLVGWWGFLLNRVGEGVS